VLSSSSGTLAHLQPHGAVSRSAWRAVEGGRSGLPRDRAGGGGDRVFLTLCGAGRSHRVGVDPLTAARIRCCT